MRLKNRVCVITGSAMGQGKAAALLFAREGARVVVTDLNEPGGRAVAEGIRSSGGDARWHHANLCQEPEVAGLIAFAVQEYGRLDVMYNNAAFARFGCVTETSTEDWNYTIEHELTNVFFGCKHALLQMLKQGRGVIINTASAMGMVGFPESAAHMACKAAVISLTRSIALDYGRKGIRCNSISPGFIATEGTRRHAEDPVYMETIKSKQVQDDVGQPEDIVHIALYLASDEARFVNGSNFVVDGGTTASA